MTSIMSRRIFWLTSKTRYSGISRATVGTTPLDFRGNQFTHMAKQQKKLTPAQKAAKKKRQQEYMTIFVNGMQKRVKRPVTIDGMDVDEFIRRNADPIWLHQNEMWENMDLPEDEELFASEGLFEDGINEGWT